MQKYVNDIATVVGGSLAPLASASCAVYLTGTTTLASLYSDNGVTALTNPTTSSDTGRLQFYAADGRYDIVCSKTGYATTTITDVLLEDPANAGDLLYLPDGTGAVTRTIQGKLRETVSVTDFGAVGDATTDDTAAINTAIAYLNSTGTETLFFPAGNYKITSALTSITTSNKTITGDGMYSTFITATHNGDLFSVDVSSVDVYFFEISNLTLQRTAGGTYSSSCGVRIKASVASVTGLRHALFSNLRFANLYQGIVVEDTGKYTSGPFINNTRHGFFTFENLISAFATDAMYECVVFNGGTGPHHTFSGGQIRGSNAAIRLGSPGGNAGIGDIIFTGVHVVTAGVGIDVYGPSGATTYDQNIVITGCQLDNCTTATVRMDEMQNFRIIPNNSTSSVGITVTSCTNYIIEDRNTVTFQAVNLNSTLTTTNGSIADANGTRIGQSTAFRRTVNDSSLRIVGGNINGNGASLDLYGGTHATTPNYAFLLGDRVVVRNQSGSTNYIDVDHANSYVSIGNGAWNGQRLRLGTYQFWVDSSGRFRIKNGAPTSDTDGTVVGTQV
jgi:hypothetical protein